jgi:hypothetical protein
MMTYGYTIDHIAPERATTRDVRAESIKPYSRALCLAVILGTSAAMWVVLYETVTRIVL